METTGEQKMKCYCSQRLVLQIAQNGLADLESAEIDSAQLLHTTHNKHAGHLRGSAHAGASPKINAGLFRLRGSEFGVRENK